MRARSRFEHRGLPGMHCRAELRLEEHGGQALVELAIALPLLLLLLIAVVDLGRMIYLAMEVAAAARAGVQYGAQNQTTALDSAQFIQAAKDAAPDVSLTVTPTRYCECTSNPGTVVACSPTSCGNNRVIVYVQVATSTRYQPWIPYPRIPGARVLNGKAVMRVP